MTSSIHNKDNIILIKNIYLKLFKVKCIIGVAVRKTAKKKKGEN